MNKKNFKYALMFVFSLAIVAGAYMFALSVAFYPIMAFYQIFSILTICIYMYLYMRNEKLTAEEAQNFTEDECIQRKQNRKRKMKIYVALFLPFVVTVLCDYTYVLLLSEQDWFIAIMNLFN